MGDTEGMDNDVEDGLTLEDFLAIFERLPKDCQREIVELAKRTTAEPDASVQAAMIREATGDWGQGRP